MDNLWVGAYESKTFENHITTTISSDGKKFALKMVTNVVSGDVTYKVIATQAPSAILSEVNTLGEGLRHLRFRRDFGDGVVTY